MTMLALHVRDVGGAREEPDSHKNSTEAVGVGQPDRPGDRRRWFRS